MLRSRLAASAKCGGGMRCGHHQVLGASLGASLGGSRRFGPAARAASSASTLSTSTASRLPLGAVFAAGVTSAMWWGICAPDARCRDVFEEQPAVAAEAVEQVPAFAASRGSLLHSRRAYMCCRDRDVLLDGVISRRRWGQAGSGWTT